MVEGAGLRDASPRDAPQLARVIAAAFELHRGGLEPPSSSLDKTPEAVAKELAAARAIVAARGDDLIGCVFYQAQGDAIYISRLAVLPEHRGQGVAKALLVEVEARTKAAGFPRTRLSVRLALPETRALYERLGYRLEGYGRHEGYPQPTFAKLVKDL